MSLRICIVSADEAFVALLSAHFSAGGHAVSAVSHAAVPKDLGLQPHLLIVNVPAEGGILIETVSRLQKARETRHVPVIVICSHPEFEYELANLFDFLTPPLDMRRLDDDVAMVARGAKRQVRASVAEQFPDAEYRLFHEYLVSRSGLHFDLRNAKFLNRGIRSRMQLLRMESYREYFDYLTKYQESRQELQKLLQLLTVGETYFFRYRAHFDVLGRMVRKKLAADAGNTIRIWSAGCSTGEEPYSIAMTIMDAVPEWRERDISIIATDINKRSLKRAADGNYRPWALRAMDQALIWRYFDSFGSRYRIRDEVKQLVSFSHLNLKTSSFPAPEKGLADLDAVFCRNVLIYFDMESTQSLLERLADSLKPGGYLFLGHSEMLTFLSSRFERHSQAGAFYYRRKKGSVTLPVHRERKKRPAEGGASVRAMAAQPHAAMPVRQQEPELHALYREGSALLAREEFQEAEQRFLEVIRFNPEHAGALVGLGFILANRGNLEESLSLCGRALALDDLLPDAYFLKGFLLEVNDQPAEAIAEYRKAILLDMDFLMSHYRLGRLFLRLGRERDGRREMRTCLRIVERRRGEDPFPYAGGVTREVLLEQLRHAVQVVEE